MGLAGLIIYGCADDATQAATASHAEPVRAGYLADIARFDSTLAELERQIHSGGSDSVERSRHAFLAARRAYKRIEFLAEHYAPATARSINGPVIDEVEDDDPNQRVIPPEGLQVIEAGLYADPPVARDVTALELAILRANVRRLGIYATSVGMSDANILEAMRREIIRVVALGLAGFDAPVAGSAIPEAAVAMESVRDAFGAYGAALAARSPALDRTLDSLFRGAIANLQANEDFLTFDRLRFIRLYANPISAGLLRARMALGIADPEGRGAIVSKAATMFDREALDPYFFAPHYTGEGGKERTELGRLLFFDPVLSGNGRRSCASCHQPERAFSDGKAKSVAFGFNGSVPRNAPTLLNASLQSGLFYDRHVAYLEDQVTAVVANANEMHGSLANAVRLLRGSRGYGERFNAAFPEDSAQTITEQNIRGALASYIRSLRSFNSPFDRYIRGEGDDLPLPAQRGFNLFMGKGKCGGCHFMPLFNGTVPPTFEETESEILGVPERFDTLHATLDGDPGRFLVNRIEIERFAFKTTTLRNIELTAPYMHNGAFRTLEDVIDFYNRGGGAGIGIDLPRQTLPGDPLNLTVQERSDLISFLKSLTDTAGTTTRPRELPEIPRYTYGEIRKVGGEY